MTFSLFRVLWTLLHVFLTAVHFIESVWNSLRRKLDLVSKNYVDDELGFISRHVKLFNKIPSHLVVIVGNETISYRDLANVAVWSIAAGISFVSFYDHHGILKKNEAELLKALSEKTKAQFENIVWGKRTKTHGLINKNGTKNGVVSSHKLHLNIFSLSDGKGALVKLTKSLCQSVIAGQMTVTDINQDLIDEKLRAEMDIPDPELALYCGDVCSTYGFLPWQIHVTEFLQLQSHHNIQIKDFLLLLKKYGKCVQRHGK
ncbi:dehydrodolichyl diphosphate synthase complex subunit nus1 isoform X2 [Zootermopsis nevadensis]|uniref:ditrans,polycis-polyprenyl diphosphate synthase [(2E,6E)-farnesyldiphosphate specific] n=1 Tax=Zootermopsis nevadensis TaxID=136037 RepID=A0A067RFX1_ZOONE|nr:dehydrodolichyl diphosphate synthase complex subunit nus1 isoform X2 [Zootermopsis nevadensis]KDR22627.1 Nogo-B receptor [Zootermopsis nevadensis]